MKRFRSWSALLFSFQLLLSAQTIEDKIASSSDITELSASGIEQFNSEIIELKKQILAKSKLAETLNKTGASDAEYVKLIEEIKALRNEIREKEEIWHNKIASEVSKDEEGYALWDQEEISLQQLILEYGSSDYLYIIPPELGSLKVYLHSSIPIPKESWKDVLDILLSQNGIGIKTLNPYTKQLFVLKQEPIALQRIITKPEELYELPAQTRVFFVFSPPPEQAKSVLQFFEKFADPKLSSTISPIGAKIGIISSKEEILKLLELYEAVWQEGKGKVSKVIPVTKMPVKEMEKILLSFFGDTMEKPRGPFTKIEQEGLSVIAPSTGNIIVLIGTEELVKRAEKMIRDTTDQLQDPTEMTVFLYNCRHSNPEDLAKILEKVYISLLTTVDPNKEITDVSYMSRGQVLPGGAGGEGYVPSPPLIVPPQTLKPNLSTKLEIDQGGSDHFIPDVKTGNLLMVVRKDALNKIKDILRKLDVPKRMVEIEVLLFEKQLNSQTNYGLNLLRLGTTNGARYDGPNPPRNGATLFDPVGNGVLEFLFNGKKTKHFPAYDIAFSFLMSQDDIQLNAAPSIVAVNQTAASIQILEEISINNGAAPVNMSDGTVTYEKSFSRTQYGIDIIITPIVHIADEQDESTDGKGSVTLLTNITFDTPKSSLQDDRPVVDKRHIENEVRVLDGQTVILGGLRKKITQDAQEKIPFLGDIPGIGKLFGSTSLLDKNTEMFIFITPKIIQDPIEELDQRRTEDLMKRPGDIPEFLQKVVEARENEKRKYFNNSFRAIFGHD